MKKLLSVFLALALLTVLFCPAALGEEFVYEGDSGNSVDLSLQSNPTTGYTWQYVSSDESVAYIVDNGYITADQVYGGLAGAPGVSTFRIDGAAPGTAEITFTYARSWETDTAPLYSLVMCVVVDDDLNVTVFDTTYLFN